MKAITNFKHSLHYSIWLLTGILYFPIFLQLYSRRWQTIDYTHAYYILPISIWLVWRKRETIAKLLQKPVFINNALSLLMLISGLLMFIFGWRQDYLFISSLSIIPFLFGLISYLYGKGTAKALSFPILYLLLLVPPPLGILDSITLPMRYGISIASQAILNLFHYPITRQGLLLSIGGHEIFMGQPCSGMRSLITALALGLVYVYIGKSTLKNKIILLFSIIPLALAGNLLRVTSICLFTYYFGETQAQKTFHDISGFVVFIITILGLIGLESLLNKHTPLPNPPHEGEGIKNEKDKGRGN